MCHFHVTWIISSNKSEWFHGASLSYKQKNRVTRENPGKKRKEVSRFSFRGIFYNCPCHSSSLPRMLLETSLALCTSHRPGLSPSVWGGELTFPEMILFWHEFRFRKELSKPFTNTHDTCGTLDWFGFPLSFWCLFDLTRTILWLWFRTAVSGS